MNGFMMACRPVFFLFLTWCFVHVSWVIRLELTCFFFLTGLHDFMWPTCVPIDIRGCYFHGLQISSLELTSFFVSCRSEWLHGGLPDCIIPIPHIVFMYHRPSGLNQHDSFFLSGLHDFTLTSGRPMHSLIFLGAALMWCMTPVLN